MSFGDVGVKVLADNRWIGAHGIGRCAQEVLSRIVHQTVDQKGKPSSMIDSWFLSQQIKKYQPDVFFSPGYNPPLLSKKPFVFTIYDLMHLDVPHERSLLKTIYYHVVIKRAIHRATTVLTGSEYSKKRLIKWSGVSSEKIVVTYSGVDTSRYQQHGERVVLNKPYFLYVGNRRPHKNLPRLLESFAQVVKQHDVLLLLSGKPDDEIDAIIGAFQLQDNVRYAGFIEEQNLPNYYRGALAVVMPSYCEGFGLPALEGLACGRMVVAAGNTSMPEILGDQGILIDPFSVESIANGLLQALQDGHYTQEKIDARLQQARQFNWDSVAAIVKNVLLEVTQ